MSFPRLFDDGQYTMDQYQNNLGMGTLIDATSCKVTEELSGEYELELTYPLTGELFGQLQPGRIIVAKPYRNAATVQPFEIYDESRAIGGQVVFHAQHISYRALEHNPALPILLPVVSQFGLMQPDLRIGMRCAIRPLVEGRPVRKFIVVPGRLVNIIV